MNGIHEVVGSIPIGSTIQPPTIAGAQRAGFVVSYLGRWESHHRLPPHSAHRPNAPVSSRDGRVAVRRTSQPPSPSGYGHDRPLRDDRSPSAPPSNHQRLPAPNAPASLFRTLADGNLTIGCFRGRPLRAARSSVALENQMAVSQPPPSPARLRRASDPHGNGHALVSPRRTSVGAHAPTPVWSRDKGIRRSRPPTPSPGAW